MNKMVFKPYSWGVVYARDWWLFYPVVVIGFMLTMSTSIILSFLGALILICFGIFAGSGTAMKITKVEDISKDNKEKE